MAKITDQALELVLEITRGHQALLDRVLEELHGGSQPGLKQAVAEARAKIDALDEKLTNHLKDVKDQKKSVRWWVQNIITWLLAIIATFGAGHYHGEYSAHHIEQTVQPASDVR